MFLFFGVVFFEFLFERFHETLLFLGCLAFGCLATCGRLLSSLVLGKAVTDHAVQVTTFILEFAFSACFCFGSRSTRFFFLFGNLRVFLFGFFRIRVFGSCLLRGLGLLLLGFSLFGGHAALEEILADVAARVENVTGHEGVLVRLVAVFRIAWHLSCILHELFESVPLTQELNQLRVLRTNLIDQAFLFLEEIF